MSLSTSQANYTNAPSSNPVYLKLETRDRDTRQIQTEFYHLYPNGHRHIETADKHHILWHDDRDQSKPPVCRIWYGTPVTEGLDNVGFKNASLNGRTEHSYHDDIKKDYAYTFTSTPPNDLSRINYNPPQESMVMQLDIDAKRTVFLSEIGSIRVYKSKLMFTRLGSTSEFLLAPDVYALCGLIHEIPDSEISTTIFKHPDTEQPLCSVRAFMRPLSDLLVEEDTTRTMAIFTNRSTEPVILDPFNVNPVRLPVGIKSSENEQIFFDRVGDTQYCSIWQTGRVDDQMSDKVLNRFFTKATGEEFTLEGHVFPIVYPIPYGKLGSKKGATATQEPGRQETTCVVKMIDPEERERLRQESLNRLRNAPY